jgi:hypothetical protein
LLAESLFSQRFSSIGECGDQEMRSKTLVALNCVVIFVLILGSFREVSAQQVVYSTEVIPTPFVTKTAQWRITNVTSEAVEWGWGSGSFWQASANQHIIFDIHQIADGEVHGIFTIGNLTIQADDSRIAAELAFSVWPWFPGLISHLAWGSVDQAARDANTAFMEGELEILTTSTTKSFIYHQGMSGNQNTTLIYDRQTGLLLEGYTEFFFLNDYHLGVELVGVTSAPTATSYFGVFLVVIFVFLIIAFAVNRRRG